MLKEITLCVALFGSATGCSAAGSGAIQDPPAPAEVAADAQTVIDGFGMPSEAHRAGDPPTSGGITQLPPSPQPADSSVPETVVAACQGFSVGDVLFDSGRAELTPEGQAAVARLAERLPPDARIAIDGHTDDKPIAIGNQRLSELRAATVAAALVEVAGDSITIVRASGWGETQPIADNTTPEGRSLNRRVEIHVNCSP